MTIPLPWKVRAHLLPPKLFLLALFLKKKKLQGRVVPPWWSRPGLIEGGSTGSGRNRSRGPCSSSKGRYILVPRSNLNINPRSIQRPRNLQTCGNFRRIRGECALICLFGGIGLGSARQNLDQVSPGGGCPPPGPEGDPDPTCQGVRPRSLNATERGPTPSKVKFFLPALSGEEVWHFF